MDFKKVLAISLVAITAIVLSACGFAFVKDNPKTNEVVYNNGSIAVQKGEYIYYMNGFKGVDEATEGKNNFGDVKRGAIYRTKLVNGKLKLNEDGDEVINSECIVPKVVGYEIGGMYIYGDKLFYVSPNTLKDKYGELQNKLVDIYMADINGANSKLIFRSESEYSSVEYSMKKFGDSVYMMVKDGTNLYIITIKNNSASGATKISENVSSAVWTSQATFDYDANYNNAFDGHVFYTSTETNAIVSGNSLKQYNLATKATTTLVQASSDRTYTLKGANDNKIYYLITDGDISDVLYSNSVNVNQPETFAQTQSSAIFNDSYDNYYFIGGTFDYAGGVLVSNSSGTKFMAQGATQAKTISSSEEYYVLFSSGSKIYVRTTTAVINEIDLSKSSIEPKAIIDSSLNAKVDGNKYACMINQYVFYYGEYKNSKDETKYYMHIVDMNNEDQETGYAKNYLLASLESQDIIEDEEDKE